jgi:hypothetical protein
VSSTPIQQAKLRLPLPLLMQQLGLGEHAKKNARCPFHDDKTPSFSVFQTDHGWFWKCFAGCGQGDEITFLEKHKGFSAGEATKLFLEMAGCAPVGHPLAVQRDSSERTHNKGFDWQACVGALTESDLERLGNERWLSRTFCEWLREKQLVGLHNGRIAFPNSNGTLKGAHVWSGSKGWYHHPAGVGTHPFVIGDLAQAKQVHLFESQWDMMAFADGSGNYGVQEVAFVATRGNSNAKLVKGLIPEGVSVTAWPQNDEPGEKWLIDLSAFVPGLGVARVPFSLERRNEFGDPVEVRLKDMNDWTMSGATAEDLYGAFWLNELFKPQPVESAALSNGDKPEIEAIKPVSERIKKLAAPVDPVTFERWRDVVAANFPALVRPAEVCLSVIAQLLLNDVSNPFALALVDVPSSGKTITLNFFSGAEELIYTSDNFTPAAFVSHASNVKREDLGKVDLLPRIRYRTLIVRELGSVFGAKDDDLIKSLGILTRVLDGEGLETDSGVHGKRGYKGDYVFMLLAGTPPLAPRVFKVMGNFGSRLFFLALHTPEETDDELIAQNRGEDRKQKENICKRITEGFLRTLWAANPAGVSWNKAGDPDDCLRVIARCARLLAALRGAINVWSIGEDGEKLSHSVPVIEKPNRINCLLYNLARAHALICGRRQLTAEDLWPVLDLTFDSAPATRAKVFRGLIEAGGTLTTSDVEKLLRCSPPTARKEMEALSVLGVVEKTECDLNAPGRPEIQITLKERFGWFASEACEALMKHEHTPFIAGQTS